MVGFAVGRAILPTGHMYPDLMAVNYKTGDAPGSRLNTIAIGEDHA